VLAAAAAFALWQTNQRAPEDAPTNSELAADTPIGRTSLGCDVVPVEGGDATVVDPPYCTQVKLVVQECGWTEDEVSYPPDVNGGVIRFTRLNPSYPLGAATFSSQGAGGPYERFALQCIGGYGDGLYFWTPQEWDALLRPS
jgi:hypothetical protein